MMRENSGLLRCVYTPQEVGVFDVRVMWNGIDILGSPFHPKVVNPRKVRVIGGWESICDNTNKLLLTVGEEKKISFDTLGAGPGKMKFDLLNCSHYLFCYAIFISRSIDPRGQRSFRSNRNYN